MNKIKKIAEESLAKIKSADFLESPITAVVVGILVSMYMISIGNNLPYYMNDLMRHPLFKLVIVLLFVGIQRLHKYAPFILAFVLIATTQLSGFIDNSKQNIPQAQAQQQVASIGEEIRSDLIEKDTGLHPFNKDIHAITSEKVFDPNLVKNERTFYDTETAVYDLNPVPVAITGADGTIKENKSILPDREMTRYSAHNGYSS